MKKINLILLAAVGAALLVSAFTYSRASARAERFERGQRFLSNLNPDEVATVVVDKGGETVTLERGAEGFTVREVEGYRAKTDPVNRLLRDVLDLGLEKEVGSGAGLAEELGIEPPGAETTEVRLANAAGQEMVRFRIGAAHAGGGRYVQRLDGDAGPIYLTSEAVYVASDSTSYLEREIVDVSQTRVQSIVGADFELAKGEDGSLALAGSAAGRPEDVANVNRLASGLTNLTFDRAHLADAAEVAGLGFDRRVEYRLGDESGYAIELAVRGERNFLRISSFASVDRVDFTMDSSEDELREKADLLTRADEVQEFNQYHGSWIYEIGSDAAEKLGLRLRDLAS